MTRTLQRLRLRLRTDERTNTIALILGAGFIGASASVVVRLLGGGFQWVATATIAEPLDAARSLRFPWIVIIPAAGGVAAGLLLRLLLKGKAGGEGTGEIMEAVSIQGSGRLSLGRTARKSLSSILLNATGGSVGREGPIVQLAAAAVSRIAFRLRVPVERRRILIGCGVAAGMGAAYNAPIGAAMFVMEVVHGNFALEVFGPVVLASVTATMVSWGFFGSNPLYPVPAEPAPALLSLPLFALLGFLAAWTGLVLRGAIESAESISRRIPWPQPVKLGLGGLCVGLLAWWIPEVWGNGYDGVHEVLAGSILPSVLFPLLVAKITATAASLGSGGSGGVFTPALLVGAAGGALFGIGVEAAIPGLGVSPVFYALAGMSSSIASATFAPITALIIVFEMCQNYGAVMPLAIATVTATWVARQLRRDSIYTESLRRRGVDLDLAFEQLAIASLRAEDLIRRDPLTVRSDAPLAEVLDRFAKSRQTAIYVLSPDEKLIGAIDLRDAFQVAGAEDLRRGLTAQSLVRSVARVTPETPLRDIMARFSQLELAQLPVVSPSDPDHLLGTVARRDVVTALDREVLRRRLVLAQYLVGGEPGAGADSRRAGDLTIRRVVVPESWIGRSVQEVDAYRRLGLFVLSVVREAGGAPHEIAPVSPEHVFAAGDTLVLLGVAGAFDRLAEDLSASTIAASRSE